MTPDIADFSVTVSRLASTSARARTATNRRIAAVLRVARARGVAEADIATRGLSVSRERVTRRGRLVRVRYRAEQTLVIRARNVAALAALLDAIAEAGADRLGDPDFGFADPSAGRLLATRAALADARRRGDDAAATQGLRITGVRSVTLAPQTLADFGDDDSASGQPAAAWNARRPRRPRSHRGFSSSPSGSGSCTPPRRCSAGERQPVREVETPARAARASGNAPLRRESRVGHPWLTKSTLASSSSGNVPLRGEAWHEPTSRPP